MVPEVRAGRGQVGRGRAVDFRVAPFSFLGYRVPACRDTELRVTVTYNERFFLSSPSTEAAEDS